MDLSQINKVSLSTFLPTKKWAELEENKTYLVTKIKKVHTRFGERIVLELDSIFQSFIPNRVSEIIYNNQQMYDDLCDTVQRLRLYVDYSQSGHFEFKEE